MSLSRRKFVHDLGVGMAGAMTAAMVSARGREALTGGRVSGFEESFALAGAEDILLSSNENPLGPPKAVLGALRGALGQTGAPAGRYPFGLFFGMKRPLAAKLGVKPENVFVGLGSTQILHNTVALFTSPGRALVSPLPTYEDCALYAERIGTPVRRVPLDDSLRVDLKAVLKAAKGSGLVYYCNPNNPTGTLHSARDASAFVTALIERCPGTTLLVDEAYHDYVTDPSYGTQIPLAVRNPGVIVTRTFSKAYGMAGLRIGYAVGHPKTIGRLASWNGFELFPSLLAMKGALAAIGQDAHIERERGRNEAVRRFTRDFFREAGYDVADSQTNFLFVNVRRPVESFREACASKGVRVGRAFAPLGTYARISMGTMEEMKRATAVFAEVLSTGAKTAA